MRGDLDSIALKVLEKDRSRRYGSPSDFAADIRRYLNNEAVLAVPASAAYRARKFARRYRGALVTACAFALVLIVAAVVSIRQSIRANREAASRTCCWRAAWGERARSRSAHRWAEAPRAFCGNC